MEEVINNLFTTRHSYLLKCSYNCLKLITKTELANDLLTDTYMYILDNKDKYQPMSGKLESIIVRIMHMQVKWNNTQFKKSWVYHNKNIDDSLYDSIEDFEVYDDGITEEDYLNKEIDIQDKLAHIQNKIDNLPLDQRLLYDDIFLKGINTSGKLSNHTGIYRTECWRLIKKLKEEIKTGYKNK